MTGVQHLDAELATRALPAERSARGTRLARNVVFNFLGQGLPLLAAIFAIPRLINGLGTDRFGILTLAWLVIGYFSLFDLGLSRALTQVVAAKLSESHETHAPALVWPALAMMFLLGVVGAVVMGGIAPWLVRSVLKIPTSLQAETLRSFYFLAAAIPLVIVTAGLVGILSAFQRFGVLNAIRVPMGTYTFAAPLLALPFSHSLVLVTIVLVIGRLLGCAAYAAACAKLMPPMPSELKLHSADIKPLFHFGAWMTVSNIIGPLMVYLDRFVIGAILSVTAVAYYATPYEMVTKLLIVPGAIIGVLFPAFAASHRHDHDRMVRLFTRGTKYITLLLFPVLLAITGFAHEGLRWWLGEQFARNSTPVLQWLAIGVFINSLAQLLATLVQGAGRPDLTAKLHVLELPVYLLGLWWAIHTYGIVGAAFVWTVRASLDGVMLFWISRRFLGKNDALLKRMTTVLLALLGVLIVPMLVVDFAPRAALLGVVALAFVPVTWLWVLAEDERRIVLTYLRRPGAL